MVSLADDPRATEAMILAAATPEHDDGHTDTYYAGLWRAALAALPREELIEKAGRAICEWENEREIRRACLDYAEWSEAFDGMAEAVLVAIGLIPEHVTPEEER